MSKRPVRQPRATPGPAPLAGPVHNRREPSGARPRDPSLLPLAWLNRLAGPNDELDFGIYRRLRGLRSDLEQLLIVDLPQAIEPSLAPADRALVYKSFDRLIRRWQDQMIDVSPARRVTAEIRN